MKLPLLQKELQKFFSIDEYAQFQNYLLDNLEKGAIISGGGGIRKIRWNINGRGKSGGVRIVYYHINKQNVVHLIFKKNEQSNLTSTQKSMLKELVKGYEKEANNER